MKPYTSDGLNYKLTGTTLKVLNTNERMEKGDFIRPYYEEPMMSQEGGWDSTFKSEKWRGPMWHRLENELPGWVGKSYEEYMKFAELEVIEDEIVRVITL